jgi:cell wall assembly regulator SMI1
MPFPVDEKYIAHTEAKLGVRFPHSFREKMKVSNGGELETPPDAWILYPFFDSSDKKRIKRTFNDIVRETDNAKKWRRFPTNAIAIGANGAGDQLILLKEESNNSLLRKDVYWWDHETGRVNKLSNDFSELFKEA